MLGFSFLMDVEYFPPKFDHTFSYNFFLLTKPHSHLLWYLSGGLKGEWYKVHFWFLFQAAFLFLNAKIVVNLEFV